MSENNGAPERGPQAGHARGVWRTVWLACAGIALVVALFAVAGFLVAPPIARQQLERVLTETLHRPVTIERVRINPFALSATVEKLVVADNSGPADAPLLAFESLHANVAASSLVRLTAVIERVRLTRPHLRLVRLDDGRYNVQDLVDAARATPAQPEPAASAPAPRFAVFNIEVDDGRIDFDDRPEKTQHAITELRIGVPFLSSIPSQVDITVQPELRAKINGAPIGLAGATKPFKDTRETTVSLELSDVQLSKYLEYSPVPLQVRVPSGSLDTKLTLSLSTQQERLQTLTVTGSARVRNLAVQQADGVPLLAAKALTVDLESLDLVARRLGIKRVGIEEPDLRVVRRKDGSVNLLGMVGASPTSSGAARASGSEPGPAFAVRVDTLSVAGGTVRVSDETPDKTFQARLDNVSVTLDALTLGASGGTDQPSPASLKASFGVEPKGRFAYAGTLLPAPLKTEGELVLDGIRVAAFAPYYAPHVDVVVTGGQLATKGALAVDLGAQPAKVAYRGDVAVSGFSSLDGPTSQELLRWKSLQVARVDFNLEPLTVAVGQVTLADFYSRLIVNADGTLNLQGLMRRKETAGTETAGGQPAAEPAAGRAAATASAGEAGAAAPNVRVGRIELKGGTVNFSDFFVKPNYSAELLGVTGTVSEMNRTTPGDVNLRGRIGATAPVEIVGRVNPFARDLFLDIEASARDVELPGLTPYSVKYAAYGIEKGKLSLQVKYQLENRQLVAQNKIRLDQLTFGPRVDSPTATQLPVLLAVALLKDRNGVIEVDLPIAGSLDDPQFSIGGVIARVIVNLVTKIVTAPFALLGALFGGGEELAYAEFSPGAARLADADQGKLKSLAKALEERPGLKIDISGRADPDADSEALKRVLLERQLKAMKLREADRPDPAKRAAPGTGDQRSAAAADAPTLDEVVLAQDEYERLLALAWRTNAATPSAGSATSRSGGDASRQDQPAAAGQAPGKQPPRAEMEQQLMARLAVGNEDLQALASARATSVKTWLVDNAKIPAERIFIVAPRLGAEGIKDGGKATRADFALK